MRMAEARFVEMLIIYLYRGRIRCGGNCSEIPNSSNRGKSEGFKGVGGQYRTGEISRGHSDPPGNRTISYLAGGPVS